MLNYNTKNELAERLEKLSRDISKAKGVFYQRGHKSNGVHMSNLINIEMHQRALDEQLDVADDNLWQNMKHTWHEEMHAVLDSFAKVIEYEDEEFKKNSDIK